MSNGCGSLLCQHLFLLIFLSVTRGVGLLSRTTATGVHTHNGHGSSHAHEHSGHTDHVYSGESSTSTIGRLYDGLLRFVNADEDYVTRHFDAASTRIEIGDGGRESEDGSFVPAMPGGEDDPSGIAGTSTRSPERSPEEPPVNAPAMASSSARPDERSSGARPDHSRISHEGPRTSSPAVALPRPVEAPRTRTVVPGGSPRLPGLTSTIREDEENLRKNRIFFGGPRADSRRVAFVVPVHSKKADWAARLAESFRTHILNLSSSEQETSPKGGAPPSKLRQADLFFVFSDAEDRAECLRKQPILADETVVSQLPTLEQFVNSRSGDEFQFDMRNLTELITNTGRVPDLKQLFSLRELCPVTSPKPKNGASNLTKTKPVLSHTDDERGGPTAPPAVTSSPRSPRPPATSSYAYVALFDAETIFLRPPKMSLAKLFDEIYARGEFFSGTMDGCYVWTQRSAWWMHRTKLQEPGGLAPPPPPSASTGRTKLEPGGGLESAPSREGKKESDRTTAPAEQSETDELLLAEVRKGLRQRARFNPDFVPRDFCKPYEFRGHGVVHRLRPLYDRVKLAFPEGDADIDPSTKLRGVAIPQDCLLGVLAAGAPGNTTSSEVDDRVPAAKADAWSNEKIGYPWFNQLPFVRCADVPEFLKDISFPPTRRSLGGLGRNGQRFEFLQIIYLSWLWAKRDWQAKRPNAELILCGPDGCRISELWDEERGTRRVRV